MSEPKWIRSTFCDSSACLEVAFTSTRVLVRDSQQPNGPTLYFTHDEFRAFIEGAKAGDFDEGVNR